MKEQQNPIHKHITSFQLIILGFLSLIILGSLLLMLPISTRDGEGAAFSDALFTATSATCVTGLVVRDTATYWSVFGQCIILVLIQIGGMGIVTAAVAFVSISGRKIGLMQRSTMQEAVSAHHLAGVVRLTNFILKTMVVIEILGAALLAPYFIKDFGVPKGIWYSVFHSISAFCNAGFDLLGAKEPFSSLTSYSSRPFFNITIMALIIIGGIGFLTWEDIKKNKFRLRKYRMQSKVILTVSVLLIIFPALYFFFIEYSDMQIKERIIASLFQSVTTRTAGFNTTDLSAFSETGQMMTILLMLVGGSPGSTAGGMKTTTIAVLAVSAFAVFSRKENAQVFKRRIADDIVKNAATIFLMYIVLFTGGGMIISSIEHIPLLTSLFETASAIGTVGLTLGITTNLGLVSRLILIVLMFFGRVGGLTLVFAATKTLINNGNKYPQEKITVG